MVTFRGVVKTLQTTRNFWVAFLPQWSKERQSIRFRNGLQLQLTKPEYISARNILLAGYNINQVNDYFIVEGHSLKCAGSSIMLAVFDELKDGIYDCDCQGKIILDIGGMQGESAVFFSKMGAKKVVIYEPVLAHHKFISENILLNNIDAEIHSEGIGKTDGTQINNYEATDNYFGLVGKEGPHKMQIKIRNAADVLEESKADIAKFDCEGAEESLVHVPSDVLRKIDLYIIEVHSASIRKAIIEKFEQTRFNIIEERAVDHGISMIRFKREP